MNVAEKSSLFLALQTKGHNMPVVPLGHYTVFGSKKLPLSSALVTFKSRFLGITYGFAKPNRHNATGGGYINTPLAHRHANGPFSKPSLGRRLHSVERLRCPAGTVNGGKFSRRGLAGCGGPVNDSLHAAAEGGKLQRSIAGAGNLSLVRNASTDSGRGNAVLLRRGARAGRAVQISRVAKIRKH